MGNHYSDWEEEKLHKQSQRWVDEWHEEWEEFVGNTNLPEKKDKDNVNHPEHYCSHASGIECIQITEHMNFCLGNCLKYVWRAGLKEGGNALEDLKKAKWYIEREIQRLEK